MELTITIKLDNAVFSDGFAGYEVARILRKLADKYGSEDLHDTSIMDVNGNRVGEATLL